MSLIPEMDGCVTRGLLGILIVKEGSDLISMAYSMTSLYQPKIRVKRRREKRRRKESLFNSGIAKGKFGTFERLGLSTAFLDTER